MKHSELNLENLKEYSDEELLYFLKFEKAREDKAYQIFCYCAPSIGSSQLKIFCEAARNQRLINLEIKRRKVLKNNHI